MIPRTTRALAAGFKVAALERLRYGADVAGAAAFVVLLLFVFAQLWESVAVSGMVGSFTIPQLLLHLLLAEAVMVAPGVSESVGENVRSGALAVQLLRPVGYVGFELSRMAGAAFVRAGLIVLVGLPVIAVLTGLPPVSARNAALGVATLALALLIECCGRLLVGLLAFWLEDATPFAWLWQKFGLVAGGVLLPLTLCPDWFRTAAAWLPFGAILSGPSRAVLAADAASSLRALGVLGAWGLLLLALLGFVHARAARALQVNGG